MKTAALICHLLELRVKTDATLQTEIEANKIILQYLVVLIHPKNILIISTDHPFI